MRWAAAGDQGKGEGQQARSSGQPPVEWNETHRTERRQALEDALLDPAQQQPRPCSRQGAPAPGSQESCSERQHLRAYAPAKR